MEKQLPKILSVSLSTWRTDSGIHTQTDLFKFWDPDRVAQIYTKADLPNTPVCNTFFQISENAVIKSVFSRKRVGRQVKNGSAATADVQKAIDSEKALYAKAHKRKSWFLTLLREFVWKFGCWKSKELDSFVKDFDPDVYFMPIYPVVYMGRLQLHVLKKNPKPYVCYLADDNYSYKTCGKNIFAYIHRFWLRKVVKKLAKNCTEMFVITQTEAEDTDQLFGTQSIVLTKGIDYSNLVYRPKPATVPIKMVYTGKMIIGRANSLVAISKAMANINKNGEKITMDIYSPDVMDDQTMRYLNTNGCHFRGVVSKEEVAKIQDDADVVVFVESLEKKHRLVARLSFSTKLTDYFKSGKCIFAIGDNTIAPIVYLRQNDAAIISTEYSSIEENLRKLIDDPRIVEEYGKKAFDCGKRNHDEAIIKERFISTFLKAAREKGRMSEKFDFLEEKKRMAGQLLTEGVDAESAELFADCLAVAELYGVTSHGTRMLNAHIEKIRRGEYNLSPHFTCVRETAAFAVIDGDNAMGPISADYCMRYACERCEKSGMFTVYSNHNNTFGPAFYYPLKAAEKGYIAIIASNSPAQMPPMGGREKMLGTNPFAIVIPVPGEDPVIIDMASSIVAKSKFKECKEKGLRLPDGWALDINGIPTNDPDEGMRGLVLPMAGFKGYGIALLIDVLSGVLSGAAYLDRVGRFYSTDGDCMNVGFYITVIDPTQVLGDEYEKCITDFVTALRTCDPIPGQMVSLPGDDRLKIKKQNLS